MARSCLDESLVAVEKSNEVGAAKGNWKLLALSIALSRRFSPDDADVFLEPIDSPVLFAASRAVAIQGEFPSLRVDSEGSAQTRRHEFDRVIYKALSDMTQPEVALLRRDARAYQSPSNATYKHQIHSIQDNASPMR